MIKSTSETRERRIHRENMDIYVFIPSRDTAAASMLVGAGLAVSIVAVWAKQSTGIGAAVFFIVGMSALFCGAGWLLMIRARLDAYYHDIMSQLTIDEATSMEHDAMTRPDGIRPIPVTTVNGTRDVDLHEFNPLTENEWVSVAHAIIYGKRTISEAELAKKGNFISQPQYAKFFSYMIGAKYMEQVNNKNLLTDKGSMYLRQWLGG
jgi:hypothetical protein